jgi:hypothetical protein
MPGSMRPGKRRRKRLAIVIASEAKQSIALHQERMDCFVASASRNDVDRHEFAFPRRNAPELCIEFLALKSEGAGKAGCTLHPRSRVQMGKENAHEHTGSAEAIRPSLRNGFTAYFVLSLVTGLCCHHHPRECEAFIANLTPASGCRDHTTSPSASRAVRQRRIRVHRIPSRVCDDRERPSGGTGWGGFYW